MRTYPVVVPPPVLDEHLSFLEGVEDLGIEQFVSELAIERFDVAILPGAAGFDKEWVDLESFEPVSDSCSTKLGTVIGTDMFRWSMLPKQVSEGGNDIIRAELSLHGDSQALFAVLVDDGEHPQHFAVVGSLCHKVIRPHMIGVFGSKPHTRTVIQPQPASFRLFGRYFESFLTPDSFHSLNVHLPA